MNFPYSSHITAAFALSSGTIGAAMSASLSRKRAIALSYGTFLYPTPASLFHPAHRLAGAIITQLWNNWGPDPEGIRGDGEVDLYNVNIPMVTKLLSSEGIGITWSTMWRNSYGRLFSPQHPAIQPPATNQEIPVGRPDSPNVDLSSGDAGKTSTKSSPVPSPLLFKFSPDMQNLVKPSLSSLPTNTDAWAVHSDLATVTPLRASFAEPPPEISMTFPGEAASFETGVRHWKMKL
jgi:tubulin---tyrosine ligase